MCFTVSSCLFCISLQKGTKVIAFIYMALSLGLSILYLVPLAMLGDGLPPDRTYFYGAMAVSSVALFVTSCLLVYAEFWKVSKFFWPWLVAAWSTSMALGGLCVGGMVTVSFRAANLQEAAAESCVISGYFTHALVLFLCACVVHSRHVELVAEEYAKANKRLMYPIMYNVHRV